MSTEQIHGLIPKVALAVGAIRKDRKNAQQGYSFRGIDDVLNAVHGPMCSHGIYATSRVFDVHQEERASKNGGLLIYTRLMLEVTWHAEDGSKVSTVTAGEAMDSADKSTNKAMSAALKYAYFQTFSIPLEEPDADETTPEPAPKQEAKKPANATNGHAKTKAEPPKQDLTATRKSVGDSLKSALSEIGCKSPQEANAVIEYASERRFTLDACRGNQEASESARMLIETWLLAEMQDCQTREKAISRLYEVSISAGVTA